MKRLGKEWLTEGRIDFEYKKYLLLAYLNEVADEFADNKLYPPLAELVDQLNYLISIKRGREDAKSNLRKDLQGIDWERLKLIYKDPEEDSELLKVIDQIISFALPEIEGHIGFGIEIYEWVESSLSVEPLGLLPLNKEYGYLFLYERGSKEVKVYSYESSLIHHGGENYRSIRTSEVKEVRFSLNQTLEQIKWEIIRENKHQSISAAYYIESRLSIPWRETFFPVAKRTFMKYLAEEAA